MNDAHLHLQDSRFSDVECVIAEMLEAGVERCVMNGTGPEDWDRVRLLGERFPELVIPSYGLHPWKTGNIGESVSHTDRIAQRSIPIDWKTQLVELLEASPLPCIGECGLDRWMKDPDKEAQEDAFLFQIDLAYKMNAPLSIHVLKAWGWFMELLRSHPFPERGFLLHSYNGSKELLAELIEAGAYFSFSGYYLHEKKQKQQEVFRAIPLERLLVETDAPDMLPPEEAITHPLVKFGELNHPANLPSISRHLAGLLGLDHAVLENQLDANFSDFFLRR